MSNQNQASMRRGGGDGSRSYSSGSATSTSDPIDAPAPVRDPRSERPEWMTKPVEDMHAIGQVIARYPLASLVAGFSVGFGLGVLATAILPREDRGWMQRNHLRESLHDLSSSLAQLPRTLAEHWPDSLKRR